MFWIVGEIVDAIILVVAFIFFCIGAICEEKEVLLTGLGAIVLSVLGAAGCECKEFLLAIIPNFILAIMFLIIAIEAKREW